MRKTTKTFITANKEFIKNIKPQTEETTLRGYISCANRIDRLIGFKRLNDMTRHVLQQFINEEMTSATQCNGKIGYSKKTRKNTASYLSILYEFFDDKGVLRKNPCASGLKVKGQDDRQGIKAYSENTLNKLQESGTYLSLSVLFCALTGMRPSETIALTYSDLFEFEKNKIALSINSSCPLGRIKSTKTKSSRRNIFISKKCSELLDRILRFNNSTLADVIKSDAKDKYLLTDPITKERYMGSHKLYHRLKTEFERLRLNYYGVQPCRHTFATRCANIDMPFEKIANFLGHSNTEMIKARYANKEQLIIGRNDSSYLDQI